MMRVLILGLGLFAAACASAPREIPQASAVVETVRVEMDIRPEDNGLSWAQIDLVEALAGEYKSAGTGPFVISYPENAANADTAIQAIANVRTRLYQAGLSWPQIAGSAYDARGRAAPIVFTFKRYYAVAPDCEEGWDDLRPGIGETRYDRFGCATAQNLAAMVANPRDLAGARRFDDPDTERRMAVIRAWQAGERTQSDRGSEESGAVSDSVD